MANLGQHSCTPSEVSSAERSFQKSLVYDNERETHAVALPLNNSARSASSSEMPTGFNYKFFIASQMRKRFLFLASILPEHAFSCKKVLCHYSTK